MKNAMKPKESDFHFRNGHGLIFAFYNFLGTRSDTWRIDLIGMVNIYIKSVPTPTVLLLLSLKVLLVYRVMILLLPTPESPITTTSTISEIIKVSFSAWLTRFHWNEG